MNLAEFVSDHMHMPQPPLSSADYLLSVPKKDKKEQKLLIYLK